MYSKAETAQIKTEFWTSLGQYMKPVADANGNKINWINYKTGKKGLFFRMRFDKTDAQIFIEISSNNYEERTLLYEKLNAFKEDFDTIAGKDFIWLPTSYDDFGKPVSKILKQISGVSIFKKEDWPVVISFLKENMIKLDIFWQSNKDFFLD